MTFFHRKDHDPEEGSDHEEERANPSPSPISDGTFTCMFFFEVKCPHCKHMNYFHLKDHILRDKHFEDRLCVHCGGIVCIYLKIETFQP